MIKFQAIQAAALRIAEQFKPQKIILFGSYAYGTPNADSDVDYMVLMRGRNVHDRAMDIRMAIDFDFPVDLLVRSPAEFSRRIALGDFFLLEVSNKGKVLYEAADKGVGGESRGRLRNGKAGNAGKKITQLRQRVFSRPAVW